jgi:NCS1 family nucleobase:cation symporter-1
MIAVFTADYFIVRKQKVKLTDLYRGSSDSIYWFWHGINWRGYVSWTCGFVPGIVGFASVNPAMTNVPQGAVKLFQMSFIIGYIISFIVHVVINFFFPPPGVGEYDEYDVYGTFTREEAEKLGVIPHESLAGEDTDEFLDPSEKDIQSVPNKIFKSLL